MVFQRRQLDAEVRRRRTRLTLVGDAALLIGERAHAVVAGPAWEELTGQTQEDAAETGWTLAVAGPDRSDCLAHVDAARGDRRWWRVLRPDGSTVWTEWVVNQALDRRGRTRRLVTVTLFDTTRAAPALDEGELLHGLQRSIDALEGAAAVAVLVVAFDGADDVDRSRVALGSCVRRSDPIGVLRSNDLVLACSLPNDASVASIVERVETAIASATGSPIAVSVAVCSDPTWTATALLARARPGDAGLDDAARRRHPSYVGLSLVPDARDGDRSLAAFASAPRSSASPVNPGTRPPTAPGRSGARHRQPPTAGEQR